MDLCGLNANEAQYTLKKLHSMIGKSIEYEAFMNFIRIELFL